MLPSDLTRPALHSGKKQPKKAVFPVPSRKVKKLGSTFSRNGLFAFAFSLCCGFSHCLFSVRTSQKKASNITARVRAFTRAAEKRRFPFKASFQRFGRRVIWLRHLGFSDSNAKKRKTPENANFGYPFWRPSKKAKKEDPSKTPIFDK